MKGIKYDQEKRSWSLILEINKALDHGAKKYSEGNWRHVKPFHSRYFGAIIRHVLSFIGGEVHDPESGVHHLGHAGACLLFLYEGPASLEQEDPFPVESIRELPVASIADLQEAIGEAKDAPISSGRSHILCAGCKDCA